MPYLLIAAAAALAHIWCLGSRFYLDDIWQIRDSEVIREGRLRFADLQPWTYFWYIVEARVSGMSPVAFHALNWLLHVGVACTLYVSARDYLRGRGPQGAALFGAVLFAVHPLGSEIPNYVRTQDIAWVTLFSLAAAWLFSRFLRDGGWRYVLGSALCILGATFSKGPGMTHALMMTGVVALASLETRHVRFMSRLRAPLAGLALAAGVVVWWCGLWRFWLVRMADFSQPRVLGHAFTICRVFWEFAWRCVVPVRLSADHHIAETLVRRATGCGDRRCRSVVVRHWHPMLCGGRVGACLAQVHPLDRGVFFPVCWHDADAVFLFRARVHAGVSDLSRSAVVLPGSGDCAGAGMAHADGKHGARPTVALVLVFAALSAKRSFLWHDLDRLMADVLEQYPTQARAVWVLQARDADEGRWQAVIDRHRTLLPEVSRRFHEENRNLKPDRELPTGHHALAEVGCWGLYARALAMQRGPQAGLLEINRLEEYMRSLHLDPLAHAIHWSHFHHAKGLVLEIAGDYQAAAEYLRMESVRDKRKLDLQRVEAKIH